MPLAKEKSKSHFLSLIIPSYRQGPTIVDNVRKIRNALNQVRYPYEIIVVIDGRIDNTLSQLRRANIKNVNIISYKENQGKFFAVRLGMKEARGDYVMFLDAGGEIHPNGISMLLAHMEWYKADIICGSKRHPASLIKWPVSRRILSYGYHVGVRLLFNLPIRDTQAGIKVFRKHVLEKILPRLMEKKFTGDLEMLVVSRRLGFKRIYEAPIRLDHEFQKVTSAVALHSIVGMALDTLAIYYRTYILKYYDRAPRNRSIPSSFRYSYYPARI